MRYCLTSRNVFSLLPSFSLSEKIKNVVPRHPIKYIRWHVEVILPVSSKKFIQSNTFLHLTLKMIQLALLNYLLFFPISRYAILRNYLLLPSILMPNLKNNKKINKYSSIIILSLIILSIPSYFKVSFLKSKLSKSSYETHFLRCSISCSVSGFIPLSIWLKILILRWTSF